MAVLDTRSGGAILDGTSPAGISAFPFTFACWVRRIDDHSANGHIMALGNSEGGQNLHTILSSATNLAGYITRRNSVQATQVQPSGTLATGSWTPLVFVAVSNTERYLYEGSRAALSDTTTDILGFSHSTNSINSSTGRFALGRAPNFAGRWLGLISHVAIWDKALTEAERNAFLDGDNPLTIADSNLRAYWAEDFFQDIDWYYEDKSGNGNHLLLEANAARDTDTAGPTIAAPIPTGLAFTVAPSITTRTTTSYTLGGTANLDCDVYAVATLTAAGDPDGPQIVAGNDGDDSPAESAATVAATAGTPFTLTLSGLTESAHNIHIVPRRDAES
jgi:hypothetical protein